MQLRFTQLSAALLVCVASYAVAQAPAGAPAGSTGVCNDGTYSSAATKSGACRGHKGIKTWFAPDAPKAAKPAAAAAAPKPAAAPAPATAMTAKPAAAPAPAPAPAPATAMTAKPAAAPAAKPATTAKAPKGPVAPGGGPGLVWVNTSSNVYHCSGDADYGTTKAGKYLTEPAAKAAGARPSHGKTCS